MKKETKTILIGIGITILVLLLAFLIFYICYKKSLKSETKNENTNNSLFIEKDNANTVSSTKENNSKKDTDTQIKDTYVRDENTNNKVTVYLFRGEGCPHCESAENYFKTILGKYDYLEIKAIEIWNNDKNNELAEKVASDLKIELEGVPLIVIGTYNVTGFSEKMEEELETEIEKAHKNKNYQDMVTKYLEKNNNYTIENLKK